jgi:hypothetical protein
LFLQYWGLNPVPTPWTTLPAIFWGVGFFEIGSQTICLGWLRTSWSLPPE